MGANLKGLSNTLKNKIYQAKKKGIDTSFIPRGYSKLSDSQKLNLINRLGQQTNGKNYSYQGINSPSPKKRVSKPKTTSRIPKSELQDILNELNYKRNQLGNIARVNSYLGREDVGEYQSLQELNFLLYDFKDIKGDISAKDITKIAKKNGFKTQKKLAYVIKSKLDKFHLETYKDTLKYYGITDDEIKKMDEKFRKADYQVQDKFLYVIAKYKKGKEKYDTVGDESNDHVWAKDNFIEEFTRIVDLGR